MLAAYLIKCIHSISTQCEPNISWFIGKVSVVVIEILPRLPIGWMLKLPIVFVLIRSMPTHNFGILRVSEQTPQSINDGNVPHHQSRNLFEYIIVCLFFLFAREFRSLLLCFISLLPFRHRCNTLFHFFT
jgi:hypothetical protein